MFLPFGIAMRAGAWQSIGMQTYQQAIAYLAGCKYVCPESVKLIARLYDKPGAMVRRDIEEARGKK